VRRDWERSTETITVNNSQVPISDSIDTAVAMWASFCWNW
jgi:hypothetical protein